MPIDRPSEDAQIAVVWDALDGVRDPCHVLSGHDLSILDLGLVNRVTRRGSTIEVGVTFTEVGCTFGYRILEDIEALGAALPDVVELRAVVEPFPMWTPERLSERAKAYHQTAKLAFGSAAARARPQPSSRT